MKWLLLFFLSCATPQHGTQHALPMPDWQTCERTRRAVETDEGHLQAWSGLGTTCRPDGPGARVAGDTWTMDCRD